MGLRGPPISVGISDSNFVILAQMNGTNGCAACYRPRLDNECVRACMRACVRACVLACLRACVRACVRAFVRACMRACVLA